MFETREERLDKYYRKVEAMVRQRRTIDEICRECKELSRIDVLDIDQRIFAKDQERYERERRFRRRF